MEEGTNNFNLEIKVPLVTSFEFVKDLRDKCPLIAHPQLIFNGFYINEDDPFFIPKTEEELEDEGIGDILPDNPTKIIIEKVRKRKGLILDKKIVIDAAK